ncbi:HAD-IB family hydrolase [Nocardia sp. NPDC088792]|uniref:HAD-IB family hydrolase n=1 Tax=Nocardia sp. NPDC088792 TaxID=3364332 RepID=UPI003811F11B
MNITEVIAAVRSGPQGPRIAAVFDYGGTVVHGYPLRQPAPWRRDTRRDPATTLLTSIRGARGEGEFHRFLLRAATAWAGHPEVELDTLGEKLFHRTIYGHLYPEAWQLIRAHQAAGHTVVLVTCLARYQVMPAARELGIEHVLCTAMEVRDGVLTGHVDGEPLWRRHKADAVRKFAAARGLDLSASYAYADAAVDIPLLASAGHPCAVNPDPGMVVAATDRNWPMLKFPARAEARARDIARTAASFAGLLGGSAFGILREAGTRDRRRMAYSMLRHASGAILLASGVRVRVSGAEHVEAAGTAVVIFNHQSSFDMVAISTALRGRLTCVVKKELFRNPVFGPLMRFVGATFIDRSGGADARAELAPVVETLKGGVSVVISPEGTRSVTPRVGPFKKGAFHVALQAGVPILPIVVRNSGGIVWRNGTVVHKGVVDVLVLPPIDVSTWDPDDMDAEIERVRQSFDDTLVDWPAPDPDSAVSETRPR